MEREGWREIDFVVWHGTRCRILAVDKNQHKAFGYFRYTPADEDLWVLDTWSAMREAGFETLNVLRVNTDEFHDSSNRLQKSPWSSQNHLSDDSAWNARIDLVAADTVRFLCGESSVAREAPSVGHAYFDGFDMQQPKLTFQELPITIIVHKRMGCGCEIVLSD